MDALRAFTNHIVPGRWDELRPVTDQELAATSETVSVETAIEELFGLGRSSVAVDAQRLPRPEELNAKEK